MTSTVLVVEDNKDMANLLNILLSNGGHFVKTYSNGTDFLKELDNQTPDLIILDILLPDISGLELCLKLKNKSSQENVPVIALTARSEEFDVVTGLNIGFDDYITKPFSQQMLLAKINAILRRENRNYKQDTVVKVDNNFIINHDAFEVFINDQNVNLSPLEFKTLSFLVKNKDRVMTREQIFNAVKENRLESSDRSIDITITKLRKKLGNYSKKIVSVYGIGYSFR